MWMQLWRVYNTVGAKPHGPEGCNGFQHGSGPVVICEMRSPKQKEPSNVECKADHPQRKELGSR
jgi:hypothetical protein